jgi:hypothetical protein
MRLAGEFRYDISQDHLANPFLAPRRCQHIPTNGSCNISQFHRPVQRNVGDPSASFKSLKFFESNLILLTELGRRVLIESAFLKARLSQTSALLPEATEMLRCRELTRFVDSHTGGAARAARPADSNLGQPSAASATSRPLKFVSTACGDLPLPMG